MTLDLVKCAVCGKAAVLEEGEPPVCADCVPEVKEVYSKVRSLLRDFPNAQMTVPALVAKLKVDEKIIQYLVSYGYFDRVLVLRDNDSDNRI